MRASRADKKLLMVLSGVMVLLIVAVAVLAPRKAEDDPRPTSTNNGPMGVKAAYLTLERLGWRVSRWDRPLVELNAGLSDEAAARSTLVLAEPQYDETERKALVAAVTRFLERGGRVVATGNTGALLLGGEMRAPSMLQTDLCESVPEGPGPLAAAGSVEISDHGAWASDAPKYVAEQRCGGDAVVVSFAVGGVAGRQGEAVWWSSATAMDNAELKNDGNLRLLLAAVGTGRDVVFDEALFGAPRTMWDAAKGLPLVWLALQATLLFVLLVLSFSRRRGPLRVPVMLPRNSPVEFAESMGDLYERGGATAAAVSAARRRLLQMLGREAGVPASVLARAPEEIAEALRERVPGDWSALAGHLQAAQEAAESELSERSALVLVRALRSDADFVREQIAS
jgi:hypothetical protein